MAGRLIRAMKRTRVLRPIGAGLQKRRVLRTIERKSMEATKAHDATSPSMAEVMNNINHPDRMGKIAKRRMEARELLLARQRILNARKKKVRGLGQ
jgi:hypothetical protein